MIQYAYYHNGKEYVSELSVNRDDARFETCRRLFEAVRTALGGEGALYAPFGSDFVLLRSFNEAGRYSVRGLFGSLNEIAEIPARYFGALRPAAGISGEGRLPELRRADLSSLFRNAAAAVPGDMFAKLFDAFVCGNQPVLLHTSSWDAAENATVALFSLFPQAFVRGKGVCFVRDAVPDSISFTDGDGAERKLSVSLFAVYGNKFFYDSYVPAYTVFDAAAGQDNYARTLSAAGRALQETGIDDWRECERFASFVAPAFTERGADTALAEQRASLYRFERDPVPDAARAILAQPADAGTVAEAIRCLLAGAGEQPLSAEDAARIRQEFMRGGEVASAIEDDLSEYCVSHYRYLAAEDRELFAGLLTADSTGNRFAAFLRSAQEGDYKSLTEAFELVRRVVSIVADGADGVRRAMPFLRSAVHAFDIRNCFRIPMDQISKGEQFFVEAARAEAPEMRALLVAVLMFSAYFTGPDRPLEYCELRLRGFRLAVNTLSLHGLDTIAFILAVRSRILEIAEESAESDFPFDERDFDFIFNSKSGAGWVNNILSKISATDLLRAEMMVRMHSANRRNYESMQNAVQAKLLDAEFVRRQIGGIAYRQSGRELREKYIEFFESLPESQRRSDIAEYLGMLGHETSVDENFARYRFDFAAECYRTMQESDRVRVVDSGSASSYDGLEARARLDFVERTINVFGTVVKRRKKGNRSFSLIGIWGFFFGVLALAALLLPAIVIPISLGTFDWQHIASKILDYFLPAFVAIPLAVFVLDIAAFLCLKEGNRVLRANLITLLCGVLPVLLFSAGHIVCYYVLPLLPFVGA